MQTRRPAARTRAAIPLIFAVVAVLTASVLPHAPLAEAALEDPVHPPAPPPLDYPGVPVIVGSEGAGHLAGLSAVTPTGQYTYRIPIDVPPGRAGIQPGLALVYSSGGGNSTLGVGWSLEGLSSIRRCPKTRATEGLPDGVDFDATDSYCLDSQKLRRVDGGQGPVLEGAEFRPEQDSFTKVVAHGDSSAGPDSFTAYTKAGLIFEYAKRVEPHRFQGSFGGGAAADLGPVRAAWLVTEMRDRSGNKMVYDYDVLVDPVTGGVEPRLHEITYTETYDGKPGRRSVQLVYDDDRPDTTFRYESGVRWEQRSLLKKILLRGPDPVDTETLGEYRLSYEPSPDTGRSLLTSVERCDSQDVCLRAKQFQWWKRTAPGQPPVPFQEVAVTPFDAAALSFPTTVIVADFNGDALDDVLYRVLYDVDQQPVYLHLAQMSPAGVSFTQGIQVNARGSDLGALDLVRSRPIDLDGDGRAELLAALDPDLDPLPGLVDGYAAYTWDESSSQFVLASGAQLLPGDPALDIVQLTDLDGDGRPEMFREEPDLNQVSGASDLGQWLVAQNEAGTFQTFKPTGLLSVNGGLARAMDINGDGRGDLLPIDWDTAPDGNQDSTVVPGATILLGLDDDGHMATDGTWRLDRFNRLELVDLNGDGLRDALYPDPGGTTVRWNLGNGFGPAVALASDIVSPPSSAFYPDMGLRSGDFDGDGREDLVSFGAGKDLPGFEQIRWHRLQKDQIQSEELGLPGTAPLQHEITGASGDSETVQDGWPYCRLGDFNGDGLLDIVRLIVDQGAFQLRAAIQAPSSSDLLQEVRDEDAPSAAETVIYARTPVDDTHACTWPQRCVKHGLPVVQTTVTASGGDLATYRYKNYRYEDPRMDLTGRGFLGFGKVTVFDPQLRSQTVTEFDHATSSEDLGVPAGVTSHVVPFAGLPKHITHIAPIFPTPDDDTTEWPPLPDGPIFARVTSITNTYALVWTDPEAGTYVVHATGSTTIESEQEVEIHPDSVSLVGPPDSDHRHVDTTTFYDAYENPTFVLSLTYGGTVRHATFTYDNREDDWLLGLPTRSEVVVQDLAGPAADPRVTTYQHDDLGRLKKIIVEPDEQELRQITHLVRTDDGLVERVTVSGEGGVRNTYFAYDEERMFVRATWNPYSHYHRAVHHPGLGVAVLTEDPNGVQTALFHDRFGRVRRVEPQGGTAASISYQSADCKTAAAAERGTCVAVTQDDGAKHVAYSDERGRTWEVGDRGFDGDMVFRRQRYNVFGQPVRATRPFKDFAGPVTVSTYDTLGRPLKIQTPDTAATHFTHTMYSVLQVGPLQRTSKIVTDKDGRIIESRDVVATPTKYGYGPFDQVLSIEDAQGNVTALQRDKLGRRTRLDDPDRGTTLFDHNALGELRRTQHLKGGDLTQPDLTTDFQYDGLGRLRYRIDVTENDPGTAETTEYEYDASPHGKGKLRRTVSPDGIETVHTYDALSRPLATQWKLADGSMFAFERSYHLQHGRPAGLSYPAVGHRTFEIAYGYNSAGWLASVYRGASPLDGGIWMVNARNLDGALTEASWTGTGAVEARTYSNLTGRLHNISVTGNGSLLNLTYGYDLSGNVTSRHDAVAHRAETFHHDDGDRLDEWKLTYPDPGGAGGAGGATVDRATVYSYDDLGNLLGLFVDGILEEIHDIDPVKPHRLADIHFLGSGAQQTFHHDDGGRLHHDTTGRQVQYTPFDLPRLISDAGKEVTFAYDAFGSRILKTSFEAGVVTRTLTLGGLYERRERIEPGTIAVQHVYLVHGDEAAVAQVVYDEATQAETTAYLARDGLGSVGVVFDKDGTELERFFHEPFGRRVSADGQPLQNFAPVSQVSLGFTGHTHDDDLGLVNMRGRVYDPVQKRFLTPDPLVSSPFDSQAYNRYSYVRNNPLRYTDPSGFQAVTEAPPEPPPCVSGCNGGEIVVMRPIHVKGTDPLPPSAKPSVPSADGRGPAPSIGAVAAPVAPPPVAQPIGPPLPPGWFEQEDTATPDGEPTVVRANAHERPQVTIADVMRAWSPSTFRAIGPGPQLQGVPPGLAQLHNGANQEVAAAGAQTGRLIVEIGSAGVQLQMMAGEAALGATARAALGAGAAAAPAAASEGGTTTFLHGTAQGESVMRGLKPVSTSTGQYPAGSFFTHNATLPNAIEAASHWPIVQGKVASTGVSIVEMTISNATLRSLQRQGLVRVGPVPGLPGFPAETVFMPGALETLNASAIFRLIPPVF